MIKIENVNVTGLEEAIRGMRNSWNSWEKSDSGYDHDFLYINGSDSPRDTVCWVGEKDHELMLKLAKAGASHAKFRRMIVVYMDITAPLYWWKEFDTYKVGTVANSCSTMHTIAEREFTLDDFSHEHLDCWSIKMLYEIVDLLNICRNTYIASKSKSKEQWWQIIQLLPSSYNQRRTVMLNYEVLHNIYEQRKNHKLDEWRDFCSFIETLPYNDIITPGTNGKVDYGGKQ